MEQNILRRRHEGVSDGIMPDEKRFVVFLNKKEWDGVHRKEK